MRRPSRVMCSAFFASTWSAMRQRISSLGMSGRSSWSRRSDNSRTTSPISAADRPSPTIAARQLAVEGLERPYPTLSTCSAPPAQLGSSRELPVLDRVVDCAGQCGSRSAGTGPLGSSICRSRSSRPLAVARPCSGRRGRGFKSRRPDSRNRPWSRCLFCFGLWRRRHPRPPSGAALARSHWQVVPLFPAAIACRRSSVSCRVQHRSGTRPAATPSPGALESWSRRRSHPRVSHVKPWRATPTEISRRMANQTSARSSRSRRPTCTAEPLVIEVVKTVEHEGEQELFLLAIDHSRQIARSRAPSDSPWSLASNPRRSYSHQ